jgi:hypothetical protein
VPFQRKRVAPEPTAQTSVGPLPQTPSSSFPVAVFFRDQTVPFQWSVVPFCPTAHTSAGPLPQIALRVSLAPVETRVQVVPSQWAIEPVTSPTDQTSFSALPQTALRWAPVGWGFSQRQKGALPAPPSVAGSKEQ